MSVRRDLVRDIELRVIAHELELVDLSLELSDGLLKIQEFQVHAGDHTLKPGMLTSRRLPGRKALKGRVSRRRRVLEDVFRIVDGKTPSPEHHAQLLPKLSS